MGKSCLFSFCVFLLIFNIPSVSFGQTDLKLLYQIDTPSKFIEVDELQNLYIVTPRNAILKYDSSGKIVTSQQFKNFGEITSIDVTNALNPQIFYAGQNRILITDNTLNSVSEISLDGTPVQQYIAGCRSSSGGFWFYDAQDSKVKHLDQNNLSQAESPNLASLGIRDLNPVYMIENLPWLYISIPSTGVAIFDQFGAYYKNVPVKGLYHFQIIKKTIVYFKDGGLGYFEIETNQQKTVTLPFTSPEVQDVKISSRRYWIETKKGVKVFIY